MNLPLGAVVDRYKVLGVLGEGGMAIVYKVRHVELETVHALKILTLRAKGLADRLLQEGRIQAKVRHPNIVAVTDVIRIEGRPALVMEYIDGLTLDALLRCYQPTLAQIDDLARGILTGVAYAHAHGLIHRDLKPGNVLVVVEGGKVVPKVTDFGLAKYLAEDADRLVAPTRTGVTMGTPTFMAPEQFKDAKNADGRADVFSLGAMLYELVTGAPAFAADNVIDVYHRMKSEEYRRVRAWRGTVPDRMERAIEGALRAEPEDRWPTTSRLLEVWSGDDEAEKATPIDVPVWEPHQVALVRSTPRADPEPVESPPPVPMTFEPGAQALAHHPTLTPASIAWPPPKPPVERRPSVYRFLGVAAAILAVATLTGLGIGALVAGVAAFRASDDQATPPTTTGWVVVETPAPDETPAPAEAAALPEPVPASPDSVTVVATAPTPDAAPRLAIRPAPAPEPRTVFVPAPVPSSLARVEVSGVERAYLVDRAGARQPVGDVDPGTYHLLAFFDPADPTMVLQDVRLAAGETRTFQCNAVLRVCR